MGNRIRLKRESGSAVSIGKGKGLARNVFHRNSVFVWQVQISQVGNDAQNGNASLLFEDLHAVGKEREVAAKLVDHQPAHEGALVGIEQPERAEQLSEDAAAVNVADEQDRRIRVTRHRHVDDVAALKVDLRRAARAFNDDEVVGVAQSVEGGGDMLPEDGFFLVIIFGFERVPRTTHQNDLRTRVGFGLDEDGIHVHGGSESRGSGLQGLGAPDLGTVRANRRVVRHVLRLERSDFDSATRIDSAQRSDEQTLACG